MEGKYVEEIITTINFSYFMDKFKILVHLWSLKTGDPLMQVKIIVITFGRI